jgi:hypothetical protein
MSKLIGEENMKNFILSFMAWVSLIEFHALILINKMALLNANTVTLLKPFLLCLLMLLFLCHIGMMLFPPHVS